MQKINNFLDRFKKMALPNEEARKNLSEFIEEMAGITVEIKDISIKSGTAFIKAGAMVKSEIFLNKKKILENLNLRKIKGAEDITNIK